MHALLPLRKCKNMFYTSSSIKAEVVLNPVVAIIALSSSSVLMLLKTNTNNKDSYNNKLLVNT